jgi:phospholipid/cholesterol/gamma-HCH transport system permease protein
MSAPSKISDSSANIHLTDNQLICSGQWTMGNINQLEARLQKIRLPTRVMEFIINGRQINTLDTAGALLLQNFVTKLEQHQITAKLIDFNPNHNTLIKLIRSEKSYYEAKTILPKQPHFLAIIGQETFAKYNQFKEYLAFVGQLVVTFSQSITHFNPLQWRILLNSIDEMGYHALPIIALLSGLIGVILAYQLGIQLQNYGADAFIVNLIGQAVLREFAPLITAIIGAGRTSSAITSQLAAMKINEEIDVLQVMGLSPFKVLVLPKILASLIAISLLIVWADIFGVLGGMLMTKAFFGTEYGSFLVRFKESINPATLIVGLSKAPVFALIISSVGCFQGLSVSRDASKVGQQTTKSVVQAMFLIIIADAIFSVIYSRLNI